MTNGIELNGSSEPDTGLSISSISNGKIFDKMGSEHKETVSGWVGEATGDTGEGCIFGIVASDQADVHLAGSRHSLSKACFFNFFPVLIELREALGC